MKLLISISSFLLGYFIFLTFYTTYKNIEKFSSKEDIAIIKDDIEIIPKDDKNNDPLNNELELPNKSDILMFLSSYNNNVINEKFKWYSEFNKADSETLKFFQLKFSFLLAVYNLIGRTLIFLKRNNPRQ